MKFKFTCFLLVILFTSSCGSNRAILNSNIANNTLTLKEVIKIHKAASPNFKTMAARIQLMYKNDDKLQSITLSLRMEKDKVIWIRASLLGVTIAKALITPDRVSYYERLTKTYFDGDFSLITKWLGTDINFEIAQDILLGQSIFNINTSDYTVSVFQNKYKLQPQLQPQDFIHSLFLNPDNFKVVLASLSQPTNERMFTLSYEKHQKLEGGYYPSVITINTTEKNSKTRIELKYKKIDLNVSVGFPFRIPEGYEEIQLY